MMHDITCDIIKEYVDEKVTIGVAQIDVKCIEALSKNMPCSIEEACSMLDKSRDDYDNAKELLKEYTTQINRYIENLCSYVGKSFSYELHDTILRIPMDNEVTFEYDFVKRKIEAVYKKDNRIIIDGWKFEKLSRLNFALLIYGSFNKNDETQKELTPCDSADSLQDIVTYMVGSAIKGKISFLKDENERYNITFYLNNEKCVIDSSWDCTYIFKRFYNEVYYLQAFFAAFEKYTEIFQEEFTDEEIIKIILEKDCMYEFI